MTMTNIADLKNNLSKFLSLVEQGEEVEICKRNVPVARIVPLTHPLRKNTTTLGCGKGTVVVNDDLTAPLMPLSDWEMLSR